MKTPGYLLFLLLCLPFSLLAQDDNTLKLLCPLNEMPEPPAEKKSYGIGAENMKAVFVSKTDTVVKACIGGIITTILHDADGKWEVMFSHDEYSFWYSGISRIIVAKGQKVQNSGTIGYVKPGERIELQMYNTETSLDPKEYLSCRKVNSQ